MKILFERANRNKTMPDSGRIFDYSLPYHRSNVLDLPVNKRKGHFISLDRIVQNVFFCSNSEILTHLFFYITSEVRLFECHLYSVSESLFSNCYVIAKSFEVSTSRNFYLYLFRGALHTECGSIFASAVNHRILSCAPLSPVISRV